MRILLVSGDSLSPEYRDGDYVLISKAPFFFNNVRRGDVIAFHNAEYGLMIKKIESISEDAMWFSVKGTHPLSIDSRHFGPVHRTNVLGSVVWHFRKSRNGRTRV